MTKRANSLHWLTLWRETVLRRWDVVADLRGAVSLLAERRTDVDDLPAYTRFLWRHLEGRWEEAMRIARR